MKAHICFVLLFYVTMCAALGSVNQRRGTGAPRIGDVLRDDQFKTDGFLLRPKNADTDELSTSRITSAVGKSLDDSQQMRSVWLAGQLTSGPSFPGTFGFGDLGALPETNSIGHLNLTDDVVASETVTTALPLYTEAFFGLQVATRHWPRTEQGFRWRVQIFNDGEGVSSIRKIALSDDEQRLCAVGTTLNNGGADVHIVGPEFTIQIPTAAYSAPFVVCVNSDDGALLWFRAFRAHNSQVSCAFDSTPSASAWHDVMAEQWGPTSVVFDSLSATVLVTGSIGNSACSQSQAFLMAFDDVTEQVGGEATPRWSVYVVSDDVNGGLLLELSNVAVWGAQNLVVTSGTYDSLENCTVHYGDGATGRLEIDYSFGYPHGAVPFWLAVDLFDGTRQRPELSPQSNFFGSVRLADTALIEQFTSIDGQTHFVATAFLVQPSAQPSTGFSSAIVIHVSLQLDNWLNPSTHVGVELLFACGAANGCPAGPFLSPTNFSVPPAFYDRSMISLAATLFDPFDEQVTMVFSTSLPTDDYHPSVSDGGVSPGSRLLAMQIQLGPSSSLVTFVIEPLGYEMVAYGATMLPNGLLYVAGETRASPDDLARADQQLGFWLATALRTCFAQVPSSWLDDAYRFRSEAACRNGGMCRWALSASSPTCECNDWLTGNTCEQNQCRAPELLELLCDEHDGQCVDEYHCRCARGRSGPQCKTAASFLFDSDAHTQWTAEMLGAGSGSHVSVVRVTAQPSIGDGERLYASGFAKGEVDFGGSPSLTFDGTASSQQYGFVMRIDPSDGSALWVAIMYALNNGTARCASLAASSIDENAQLLAGCASSDGVELHTLHATNGRLAHNVADPTIVGARTVYPMVAGIDPSTGLWTSWMERVASAQCSASEVLCREDFRALVLDIDYVGAADKYYVLAGARMDGDGSFTSGFAQLRDAGDRSLVWQANATATCPVGGGPCDRTLGSAIVDVTPQLDGTLVLSGYTALVLPNYDGNLTLSGPLNVYTTPQSMATRAGFASRVHLDDGFIMSVLDNEAGNSGSATANKTFNYDVFWPAPVLQDHGEARVPWYADVSFGGDVAAYIPLCATQQFPSSGGSTPASVHLNGGIARTALPQSQADVPSPAPDPFILSYQMGTSPILSPPLELLRELSPNSYVDRFGAFTGVTAGPFERYLHAPLFVSTHVMLQRSGNGEHYQFAEFGPYANWVPGDSEQPKLSEYPGSTEYPNEWPGNSEWPGEEPSEVLVTLRPVDGCVQHVLTDTGVLAIDSAAAIDGAGLYLGGMRPHAADRDGAISRVGCALASTLSCSNGGHCALARAVLGKERRAELAEQCLCPDGLGGAHCEQIVQRIEALPGTWRMRVDSATGLSAGGGVSYAHAADVLLSTVMLETGNASVSCAGQGCAALANISAPVDWGYSLVLATDASSGALLWSAAVSSNGTNSSDDVLLFDVSVHQGVDIAIVGGLAYSTSDGVTPRQVRLRHNAALGLDDLWVTLDGPSTLFRMMPFVAAITLDGRWLWAAARDPYDALASQVSMEPAYVWPCYMATTCAPSGGASACYSAGAISGDEVVVAIVDAYDASAGVPLWQATVEPRGDPLRVESESRYAAESVIVSGVAVDPSSGDVFFVGSFANSMHAELQLSVDSGPPIVVSLNGVRTGAFFGCIGEDGAPRYVALSQPDIEMAAGPGTFVRTGRADLRSNGDFYFTASVAIDSDYVALHSSNAHSAGDIYPLVIGALFHVPTATAVTNQAEAIAYGASIVPDYAIVAPELSGSVPLAIFDIVAIMGVAVDRSDADESLVIFGSTDQSIHFGSELPPFDDVADIELALALDELSIVCPTVGYLWSDSPETDLEPGARRLLARLNVAGSPKPTVHSVFIDNYLVSPLLMPKISAVAFDSRGTIFAASRAGLPHGTPMSDRRRLVRDGRSDDVASMWEHEQDRRRGEPDSELSLFCELHRIGCPPSTCYAAGTARCQLEVLSGGTAIGGVCECLPGFALPTCLPDCSDEGDCNVAQRGGMCVAPKTCACNDGFELPDCLPVTPTTTTPAAATTTPVAFDCSELADCSGNGECVADNECSCDVGFSEDDCSQADDAPHPSAAVFSASLGTVAVTFDKVVTAPLASKQCSLYVQVVAGGTLGSGCAISLATESSATVTIVLGSGATLLPVATLRFIATNGALRGPTAMSAWGDVDALEPASLPKLAASVLGLRTLDGCELALSGGAASTVWTALIEEGSFSRPISSYTWSTPSSALASTLNTASMSTATLSMSASADTSVLLPGSEHALSVTVVNVLGHNKTVTIAVKLATESAPSVTIFPPSPVTLRRDSDAHTQLANVEPPSPECFEQSGFSIASSWRQVDDASQPNVLAATVDGPTLVLSQSAVNALAAGSVFDVEFSARALAADSSASSGAATETIRFVMAYGKLTVEPGATTPEAALHRVTDALRLSVLARHADFSDADVARDVQIHWRCVIQSQGDADCASAGIAFDADAKELAVAAGALSETEVYRFGADASYAPAGVEASPFTASLDNIVRSVVPESTPSVVATVVPSAYKDDPSYVAQLAIDETSLVGFTATFALDAAPVVRIGGAVATDVFLLSPWSTTRINVACTGEDDRCLPPVGGILPFQVDVSVDVADALSSSRVVLAVPVVAKGPSPPPSGGSCRVDPSEASVGQLVKVTCDGWQPNEENGDSTLLYSFRVYQRPVSFFTDDRRRAPGDSESSLVPALSRTATQWHIDEFMLPAARQEDNFLLTVVASVSSSSGATTKIYMGARASPIDAAQTTNMLDFIDELLENGQCADALSALVAILNNVNEQDSLEWGEGELAGADKASLIALLNERIVPCLAPTGDNLLTVIGVADAVMKSPSGLDESLLCSLLAVIDDMVSAIAAEPGSADVTLDAIASAIDALSAMLAIWPEVSGGTDMDSDSCLMPLLESIIGRLQALYLASMPCGAAPLQSANGGMSVTADRTVTDSLADRTLSSGGDSSAQFDVSQGAIDSIRSQVGGGGDGCIDVVLSTMGVAVDGRLPPTTLSFLDANGNEVPINDLGGDGVVFVIPIPENYTAPSSEDDDCGDDEDGGDFAAPECQVRDASSESGWSSDGCEAINVTGTAVTCQCFHFSSFSVLLGAASGSGCNDDWTWIQITSLALVGAAVIVSALVMIGYDQLRRRGRLELTKSVSERIRSSKRASATSGGSGASRQATGQSSSA
jgi:REJ domain/GPCR proteolysis site, GPS, motif